MKSFSHSSFAHFVRSLGFLACMAALAACSSSDTSSPDAALADAAALDEGLVDAGDALDMATLVDGGADGEMTDAAPACELGTRVPAGDGCNFCECLETGLLCTERACVETGMGCTYDGMEYGYGDRFSATDGCNECTCGPSGLACTRSVECESDDEDTSAILLTSLTESCGSLQGFNGEFVLSYLGDMPLRAPFLYERVRELYPETRADTNVSLRITYPADGVVVCRIPMEGQEAIDIEVYVEVVTDDGAFNEGFHAYVRKTQSMFVDNVNFVASFPSWTDLHGAYDPACLDPRGIAIAGYFEADGSTRGDIMKTCEIDIGLTVGTWETPAAL